MNVEEEILRYLAEKKNPQTVEQIAARINAPLPVIRRALIRLQRLGYIRIDALSPNVEMVTPKGRLTNTSPEERERLLKHLEEFFG